MKPTRNKIHCPECGRTKMLFESEEKAINFMRFNNEQIIEETGKAPVRAYYCNACGGYHLTSNVIEKKTKSWSEHVAYVTDMLQAIEKCIGILETKIKSKEDIKELVKCIERGFEEVKYDKGINMIRYNKLMHRFKKICTKHKVPIQTKGI